MSKNTTPKTFMVSGVPFKVILDPPEYMYDAAMVFLATHINLRRAHPDWNYLTPMESIYAAIAVAHIEDENHAVIDNFHTLVEAGVFKYIICNAPYLDDLIKDILNYIANYEEYESVAIDLLRCLKEE